MTIDTIIELIKKFADVLLVWLVLYYILKNLRKNVKMVLLFKGILIVVSLKIISDLLDLEYFNQKLEMFWNNLVVANF